MLYIGCRERGEAEGEALPVQRTPNAYKPHAVVMARWRNAGKPVELRRREGYLRHDLNAPTPDATQTIGGFAGCSKRDVAACCRAPHERILFSKALDAPSSPLIQLLTSGP